MRIRSLAAVVTAAISVCAGAQSYPSKPVRLIVPYAPGGQSDIVARVVAVKVSEALGQQFVIENRAGVGGAVGTAQGAKSPADGYTLVLASTAQSLLVFLPRDLRYNLEKDFVPVAQLASSPILVTLPTQSPFKSVKDLVAHAKANPGKLKCGTAGIGDLSDLACRKIALSNGIDLQHIPFKSMGDVVQSLLGGHVDLAILSIASAGPQIKAGKLRALAVSSSRRMPALPDVPTFDEGGLSGQQAFYWHGVLAPRGTPPDVVRRLNSEFSRAVNTAEVRRYFEEHGLVPHSGSPEEFGAFMRIEARRWGPVLSGGTRTCDSPCPCTSGCDEGCCYTMYPRPPQ